jgi:hypothetical protein
MSHHPSRSLEALAERFHHFAEIEAPALATPLYEHLSRSIAADPDILRLAAQIPLGQPVANLLFAAVQYLLQRGVSSPLAQYYRSLTPEPQPPEAAYPAFRDFCLEHRTTIAHLLKTRRVQTNEVKRCAHLFLAFSIMARLAGGRPLALIEIGPSAGLNLMFDRYGYDYGPYGAFGDSDSPVQLKTTFRGEKRPPYPQGMPEVAYRVGLDLNPIDLRDQDQADWLRALVWPEHVERALLLEQAIELVKPAPPKLLAGDGMELLPEAVQAAPAGAAICVFHSYAVNQFSSEARERLKEMIQAQAASREQFYRLSSEWMGTPQPELELTIFGNGRPQPHLLAYCDSHGRWIEWLDEGEYE